MIAYRNVDYLFKGVEKLSYRHIFVVCVKYHAYTILVLIYRYLL